MTSANEPVRKALARGDAVATRLLVAALAAAANLLNAAAWGVVHLLESPSPTAAPEIAAGKLRTLTIATIACGIAAVLLPGLIVRTARLASPAARRIRTWIFTGASILGTAGGVALFGTIGFWLVRPLLNHSTGELGFVLWLALAAAGGLVAGTLTGLTGTLAKRGGTHHR
jgi:hypothetical protein